MQGAEFGRICGGGIASHFPFLFPFGQIKILFNFAQQPLVEPKSYWNLTKCEGFCSRKVISNCNEMTDYCNEMTGCGGILVGFTRGWAVFLVKSSFYLTLTNNLW